MYRRPSGPDKARQAARLPPLSEPWRPVPSLIPAFRCQADCSRLRSQNPLARK
ncbi:MAG: hypothetical protein LBH85_10080 [Treponema sp.]|nr:hypothetical protein [Treponema sp.]